MTDSQKLMAEYTATGSEAAFRELVERYVNLVYSVALRLVEGDVHRAQDVAQTVFVDLARMAKTLSPDVMLGGWLHRHACFVAANTLRGERRRQSRERQAIEMSTLQEDSGPDFAAMAPILDDAINELDDADRAAILLRFFEQQNFRAIGEVIGGSEDSARMRVNRALEKLEVLLKDRGVTSMGAALSVTLTANVVQAAPVGMAAAVSTFALMGGGTIMVGLGGKAAMMTAMQKMAVAGLLAVAVGTVLFGAHQSAKAREEVQMLQQKQEPLAAQVQELRQERDEATNRLAGLLAKQAKAAPDENELLRLRNEVTQLKAASGTNDPMKGEATAWLNRVNQLKDYLAKHPDEQIPEFQYAYEVDWLSATEDRGTASSHVNQDAYDHQSTWLLRLRAIGDFGEKIQGALLKYVNTNGGQFPATLSGLQPYCDPEMADILLQKYEIKPASILPADRVKAMNITTDWVVVRKNLMPDSNQRAAFFAEGNVWWMGKSDGADQ